MEIGGIMMYNIKVGDQGMFVPQNQMESQLVAWEERAKKSWEKMQQLREEVLRLRHEFAECSGTRADLELYELRPAFFGPPGANIATYCAMHIKCTHGPARGPRSMPSPKKSQERVHIHTISLQMTYYC